MNDFDNLLKEQSSKKFYLVRIEASRAVNYQLETPPNPSYVSDVITAANADFSFLVTGLEPYTIEVNGFTYDRVDQIGPGDTGKYQWNESEGWVALKLRVADGAVGLYTGYLQVIVMRHYLCFTNGDFKAATLDPLDSSTPVRSWANRLNDNPSFEQSIENGLFGLITLRSGSVKFNNLDQYFNQFFGAYDSFNKSSIAFYRCINDTANVKLAFIASIKQAKCNNDCIFDFDDLFSLLDFNFYAKNNFEDSTYLTTNYAAIDSSKIYAPLRKLYSTVSNYGLKIDPLNLNTDKGLSILDPQYMLKAVNVNFDSGTDTAKNREWSCILAYANAGDADFSSVISNVLIRTIGTYQDSIFKPTAGNAKYFKIGDSVKIGTYYGYVSDVSLVSNTVAVYPLGAFVNGDTVIRKGLSAVVIEQDSAIWYPVAIRDYVESIGAMDEVKITFNNNFEATLGMPNPLSADSKVSFRCWSAPGRDLKHGTIVKELIEKIGLTVNAASIAAVNILLDNKASIVIPLAEESGPGSIKSYLQLLLASTFGYLFFDEDFEVHYRLFEQVVTTGDVVDKFLDKTLDIEVSYQDIYSEIKQENKTYINLGFNQLAQSELAIRLHKVNRRFTFDSYIENNNLDIITRVGSYLTNRKALHTLRTKAENFNSLIGDIFTLKSKKMINGEDTNARLISISKSSTNSDLGLIDNRSGSFGIVSIR